MISRRLPARLPVRVMSDTTGVEPMIGAINHNKELREDKAVDSGLQAKMLANAPDSEGTAIKVPQMS